mgnify:FL=1
MKKNMGIFFKNKKYFYGLSLAFLGGGLASLIGIPLPWMLGPLIIIGISTASNLSIKIPDSPRPFCRALLGCAIGSNFSPEVLSRFFEIGLSLIILPVFILTMIFCTAIYLKKIKKFDLKSSIFCSVPGGLNEMVILGKEIGVNPRIMTLMHSTRIVVVVFFASLLLYFLPNETESISLDIELYKNYEQLPAVILVSYFGYFLGKIINLPGYTITGPMIFSGILHMFGLIKAMPIYLLIIVIQVILGSVLGAQFKNIERKDIYGPVLSGLITTMLAFIPLFIFVIILYKFDYDLISIILSYSPGGQTEMNILALSVGADMAFISTHHMFRVFMVIMFAALIQRYLK